MNAVLTRRRFIRGRATGEGPAIRPPWSITESQFLNRCTRCGECARACGEKIILLDRGGLPQIDFRLGACTFCGRCRTVCTPGALRQSAPEEKMAPWSLDVRFDADCLDRQGITCRVCSERCEQEAIGFRAIRANRWAPRLDEERCSGCGACRWVCPIDAVTIQPRQPIDAAVKATDQCLA